MHTDTFQPCFVCRRAALPIAMAALAATLAASQQPSSAAPPVTMTVPVPPSLVPTDGRGHLLYEGHVENHGATAMAIERLEIGTDGRPWG